MARSTRHYRCETALGRKGGEGGECALLERSCFALHRELPWEWISRSALSAPVAAIGDARVIADDFLKLLFPNSHRFATGRSLQGEHSESSARSPARVSDAPQLEEDCNRRTRRPPRAIHPQKVSDAAQLDEGCNGSTPCAQCAPHPGKVRDGSRRSERCKARTLRPPRSPAHKVSNQNYGFGVAIPVSRSSVKRWPFM